MNTTKKEKKATEELFCKTAVYLNENFHKFSQSNKIKISLEIFKRKIPTHLEHSGELKGNIIINIKKPAKILSEKEMDAA